MIKTSNHFMEFNLNNYSALIWAVIDGKIENVQLLLAQKGIDINSKNI